MTDKKEVVVDKREEFNGKLNDLLKEYNFTLQVQQVINLVDLTDVEKAQNEEKADKK